MSGSKLALPAVVKKDGSRTEFDRRKIVASMQLALRKRPVAADAIDAASPASNINCSPPASAKSAAKSSANS